jgi:propanol-preferring alcohol dehydrogenase
VNAIHLDRIPEFPYELLWWERSLLAWRMSHAATCASSSHRSHHPIRTEVELFALADANLALQQLAGGAVGGAAVLVVD